VDALSRNHVSGAKKDEDFFEEIQDVKSLRELGVHTWIGRRSIHGSIMNNFFMVKTSKTTKANDINKNQGIRLNGKGFAKDESK
jgi:hypothetical protein